MRASGVALFGHRFNLLLWWMCTVKGCGSTTFVLADSICLLLVFGAGKPPAIPAALVAGWLIHTGLQLVVFCILALAGLVAAGFSLSFAVFVLAHAWAICA
jgi:hypothetical protein